MSNFNQKNCMIQVKNVNIPIQIQPGYVPVKAAVYIPSQVVNQVVT